MVAVDAVELVGVACALADARFPALRRGVGTLLALAVSNPDVAAVARADAHPLCETMSVSRRGCDPPKKGVGVEETGKGRARRGGRGEGDTSRLFERE